MSRGGGVKRKREKTGVGILVPHTFPLENSTYVVFRPPPLIFRAPFLNSFKTPTSFYRAHSTRPEEEEDLASLGVMLGECSGNKNIYERGLTL